MSARVFGPGAGKTQHLYPHLSEHEQRVQRKLDRLVAAGKLRRWLVDGEYHYQIVDADPAGLVGAKTGGTA